MSTKLRTVVQFDGHVYHGADLKALLTKAFRVKEPFKNPPIWTNKHLLEFLPSLVGPNVRILSLREPRCLKPRKSRYINLLRSRGLGRNLSAREVTMSGGMRWRLWPLTPRAHREPPQVPSPASPPLSGSIPMEQVQNWRELRATDPVPVPMSDSQPTTWNVSSELFRINTRNQSGNQ